MAKGWVTWEDCLPLWRNSGLDEDTLKEIWTKAAATSQGGSFLRWQTFSLACRLVRQAQSGAEMDIQKAWGECLACSFTPLPPALGPPRLAGIDSDAEAEAAIASPGTAPVHSVAQPDATPPPLVGRSTSIAKLLTSKRPQSLTVEPSDAQRSRVPSSVSDGGAEWFGVVDEMIPLGSQPGVLPASKEVTLSQPDWTMVDVVPSEKSSGVLSKVPLYFVVRNESSVLRREKDFQMLFDCLYASYPYRMVPPCPEVLDVKARTGNARDRMASVLDETLHCERLKRFLCLVLYHPILSHDEICEAFFSAERKRDFYELGERRIASRVDEYMGNPARGTVSLLLPPNIESRVEGIRYHVNELHRTLSNAMPLAEELAHLHHAMEGTHSRLAGLVKQLEYRAEDVDERGDLTPEHFPCWAAPCESCKVNGLGFASCSETMLKSAQGHSHIGKHLKDTLVPEWGTVAAFSGALLNIANRFDAEMRMLQQDIMKRDSLRDTQTEAYAKGRTGQVARLDQQLEDLERRIRTGNARKAFYHYCFLKEASLLHAVKTIMLNGSLTEMSTTGSAFHAPLASLWVEVSKAAAKLK